MKKLLAVSIFKAEAKYKSFDERKKYFAGHMQNMQK